MDAGLVAFGAVSLAALPTAWVARWWWSRRAPPEVAVPGFPRELSASRRGWGERTVVTGDLSFDAEVNLSGDVDAWLLAATSEVRAGVRAACALDLRLSDGVFHGHPVGVDPAVVQRGLLALAATMSQRPTIAARWAAEVAPGARLRLLQWVADRPEAADVLEVAVTDADPHVRWRAAELRGRVEDLLALAVDPSIAPAVRDLAFVGLRDRLAAADLASRLLAVDGVGRRLARDRLAGIPAGPWPEVVVAQTRDAGGDLRDVVQALVGALTADPGRLRTFVLGLPVDAARAVAGGASPRWLTPDLARELEVAHPELGPLIRATLATSGPTDADPGLFADTPLAWIPLERRAVGRQGDRSVVATPGAGGTLFRLAPVPMGARITVSQTPLGRTSEVPGTASALAWFPQATRELLRAGLPAVVRDVPAGTVLLQVEDGEIRLRVLPESRADVLAAVLFLERLADELDALGSLPELERVSAAFRTAEPGAVRRKLAGAAFAGDPDLARASLCDADPDVRRAAGRNAPHPPTLVALLADAGTPALVRSVALTDLRSVGDRGALQEGVAQAWREDELVVQALSITHAERLREQWTEVAALVDRLAPSGASSRVFDQDLVRRALYVLAALDEPESEVVLLRGLRAPDKALRMAVIHALARSGGATALARLVAHAALDPGDAEVVERAIAPMRVRLGRGALTLVEPVGGEVAEADDDGRLSDPDPPVEEA